MEFKSSCLTPESIHFLLNQAEITQRTNEVFLSVKIRFSISKPCKRELWEGRVELCVHGLLGKDFIWGVISFVSGVLAIFSNKNISCLLLTGLTSNNQAI